MIMGDDHCLHCLGLDCQILKIFQKQLSPGPRIKEDFFCSSFNITGKSPIRLQPLLGYGVVVEDGGLQAIRRLTAGRKQANHKDCQRRFIGFLLFQASTVTAASIG